MNNFDLFRLNCFLNDTEANDFKRIVVSLVCEHIFEGGNKEVSLSNCYQHVINYYKIAIDQDYFISIVDGYNAIEQVPISGDVLIKLNSKKFASINDKLKEHSIDNHILHFLNRQNLDQKLVEPIKSLIYEAVYENIHTFSTENLNNLMNVQLNHKFSKIEIDAFNKFIEEKDNDKNVALYNVFLKATEFAIITSGKGVKEFSKDLFKGKTYILDTNILFRIMGIGGQERKDSLINLVSFCVHQGISFEYTSHTYHELKRKLSASVKYLRSTENKHDITALGELFESDPKLFNEDFIIHYSKLRAAGDVATPEQYELKLLTEFRSLEKSLGFKLSNGNIKVEDKEWTKISKSLYTERSRLPHGFKYTPTAAKTDTYNILFVKKLRGQNNYNYADVKSFYLSTDRTLNDILSKDRAIIPETILPSQLFILHNPYNQKEGEVDYELFLQFVKRRSTEFNFKAREVLTYIDTIRNHTGSREEMRTILQVYSDKRYETSADHAIEERKVKPIEEIIESVLDQKIAEGEKNKKSLSTIKNRADEEIALIVKRTKWIVRIVDILVYVIIVPVSVVITRKFTVDVIIILIVAIAAETLKFIITSRTPLLNLFWKSLLNWRLKSSSYYTLSKDDEYVRRGFQDYNKVNGDVWKRL